MKSKEVTSGNPLLQWNAKPPLSSVIPLGLQHVVAAIVGVVTPAIIVSSACGMTAEQEATLVQAALVMSGIITVLQLFPLFGRIGSGLPIIMGASFAYVPVFQSVGMQFGYEAILGAEIVGGIVAIIIAVLVKPIRKLFPSVVTGTVIFVIGVSLYPTAVTYMAGGAGTAMFGSAQNWFVAIITFAVVLALSNFAKGIWKLGSLLFGIVVGVLVSIPFGMVNLSSAESANWFAPPQFMPFQIQFVPAACTTIAIVFIVNCVQVIGELTATTVATIDREPNHQELAGGMLSVGLTSIIGAFFSAMPSSTFGQNVGIVITNKVINRYVLVLAGILFAVAGFVPKLASVLVAIPQPVIGGATISVFAIIAMNGIRLITKGGLKPRNATIAGTSVALGLGINQVSGSLAGANMPDWFTTVFGSSALVVATIVAIVLNLILPKDEGETKSAPLSHPKEMKVGPAEGKPAMASSKLSEAPTNTGGSVDSPFLQDPAGGATK